MSRGWTWGFVVVPVVVLLGWLDNTVSLSQPGGASGRRRQCPLLVAHRRRLVLSMLVLKEASGELSIHFDVSSSAQTRPHPGCRQ